MEPVTIVLLLGGLGWWLLRRFYPSAARKAEAAVAKFRPAFDAVEALKAAGLIPRKAADATTYFVQFLEELGRSRDEIDEGLKWAEAWARNQPRSERIAYRTVGERAKLKPRAEVAEAIRLLAGVEKRMDKMRASFDRMAAVKWPEPAVAGELGEGGK